jgi:hypothetical protein
MTYSPHADQCPVLLTLAILGQIFVTLRSSRRVGESLERETVQLDSIVMIDKQSDVHGWRGVQQQSVGNIVDQLTPNHITPVSMSLREPRDVIHTDKTITILVLGLAASEFRIRPAAYHSDGGRLGICSLSFIAWRCGSLQQQPLLLQKTWHG